MQSTCFRIKMISMLNPSYNGHSKRRFSLQISLSNLSVKLDYAITEELQVKSYVLLTRRSTSSDNCLLLKLVKCLWKNVIHVSIACCQNAVFVLLTSKYIFLIQRENVCSKRCKCNEAYVTSLPFQVIFLWIITTEILKYSGMLRRVNW